MFRVLRVLTGAFLVAIALAVLVHGQPAPASSGHNIVLPAAIQWGPAAPGLPTGAMMAVLSGDPSKEGLFVVRAKFPDGYKVSPHWHPTDEHLTVLKGTLLFGMGEKFDKAALKPIPVGGYNKAEAKMPHYVLAKSETIVQITGTGPFAITYVDPSDDPRTKSKTD
jgi:quercetin dioxygenase-like cupin family protein